MSVYIKRRDGREPIDIMRELKRLSRMLSEGIKSYGQLPDSQSFEIFKDTLVEVNRKLKDVVIPSGVKVINNNAFYMCSKVTSVTLPEGVTEIRSAAFRDCSRLERIVLPSTLVLIDSYAFKDCTSLRNISFPNSLIKIGEFAFYGCESLREIYIPGSVKFIGRRAFWHCDYLRLVTLSSQTRLPIYDLGHVFEPGVEIVKRQWM